MSRAEKLSGVLNELLQKNYDTEKMFRNAAEDVKDVRLKEYLNEKALQRYDFGHELKSEIRNFGESPEKGSSAKGDAHRAWMNLKSILSTDREASVLEEVIKAENLAIGEYNEMVKENDFPPSTANLLIKQRKAIERTLAAAKELENTFD